MIQQSLLCIYQREMKTHIHTEALHQYFITSLLKIAENVKQLKVLTNE